MLRQLSIIATASLLASSGFSQSETAAAGPTDPQIAHIVVTANTIDVAAGKLAQKSKNKEVRDFAKLMVTDHMAVNKQATALAKKLKVTPEDNDTSKALSKGHEENMAKLKTLKGTEFDKAYAEHEVAYHQQVLDAIDTALIPNAKNEELKTLLEKTRPAIAAHLEHAKKMQVALNK